MRIIIFGGGMQGCVIAKNLASRPEKPEIIIADIKEPIPLPKGVKFTQCNVLNAIHVKSILDGADAATLAVPSEISLQALKHILAAGVPVIDVSFTPEPPLALNKMAQESGTSCFIDCGVAPGLCHIMVGNAYTRLGGLDKVRIWVGGIPQHPPMTFKHAIYFNPHDLLAEYVRPARARKEGKDIAPHPLMIPTESFKDKELGKLDAFLSDGLRSLLTSYPDINDMAELTLRWPGHINAMKRLHEMGLLAPTSSLTSIASSLGANYPAKTYPDTLLMVVQASIGKKTIGWRVIDKHKNNESAMSRTTGYTAAAMTMLLAQKQFTEPGVFPPEYLGHDPEKSAIIISDLIEHGISIEELSQPVRA